MKKYRLLSSTKKMLADTLTPVSIYLKLRDKFANTILLESSDYHGNENSFSYICFQPIARFEVEHNKINMLFPDGLKEQKIVGTGVDVMEEFNRFIQSFETSGSDFNFIDKGLFGYTTFDAVRYFEDIEIQEYKNESNQIPEMLYQVYEYVIAINHFNNELHIFQHQYQSEETITNDLERITSIIHNKSFASYDFKTLENEESNLSNEEFLKIIAKGKEHCQRGDVFQIVLSRQFSQKFQGDEFNVYRALRSINPSPYLFYFDFGNFKIFGSSPEAQLVVKNQKAEIHPIAGTFRRTGDDKSDALIAQQLSDDEKENAEHVMLVDLARNDLSRNGINVKVDRFKEIQYYSHLIHLVSKVSADILPNVPSLKLFADTFPAGTLSGAPKYRALQLINQYENKNRGFYGGAIGFLSFDGSINHAIMIRSFLSKNNKLYYQAGAGIVSKSDDQSELEEVNHKLGALRKAMKAANEMEY